MRRWLALIGWLGFVAISIVALHRIGPSFPLGLIVQQGAPLEPALGAGLRLVGLAAGYWLAGSTVLYFVGLAAGMRGAFRAVRWATIAPVRRLIEGVVAGALVAAVGLPTYVAAALSPGYVPIPAGDEPAAGTVARDEGEPMLPVRDDPQTRTFTTLPVPRGEIEVVVRSGDHMWGLAEQRLTGLQGRAVSDSEVALYWVEVVAANLPRIQSADPDLIYPGEILVLPAIDP
jgi:hypothetical protein